MKTEPEQLSVLVEIRDLLRSREEKYDRYLDYVKQHHEKQVQESRTKQWLYLIWMSFSVTVGVFIGGLMLRGAR